MVRLSYLLVKNRKSVIFSLRDYPSYRSQSRHLILNISSNLSNNCDICLFCQKLPLPTMSNDATPNISSISLASGTQSHCCWYCGRGEETLPTKLQKCGRCGLAVYCNRECQRGDWKLHKAKCKRLTEIVVDTDVKNRLQSGALKRRLLTLSEGTVILSIRDPDITTIGDMNLAFERAYEAPLCGCKSLLRVDL